MPRVGGLEGAGELPIPDADLRGIGGVCPVADPHRSHAERAVGDAVGVGVPQRVADLAGDGEGRAERERVPFAHPQIETLPGAVIVVDETDAELGLDEVPGREDGVVLQGAGERELVAREAETALAVLVRRVRLGDLEADAASVRGIGGVVAEPVLPAVALVDDAFLDDPGAGLAFPARHEADALHQLGEDRVGVGTDAPARARRLEDELAQRRQVRGVLRVLQPVEAQGRGRLEKASEGLVVEEHGLLHIGHECEEVLRVLADLTRPLLRCVLELAREALRLASAQEQRGVLVPAAVAAPPAIVAVERAVVVLELDEVEATGGEDEQVALVPVTVAVPKLEVGPGAVGALVGQPPLDRGQPGLLVGELRRRHLDPACIAARHRRPPLVASLHCSSAELPAYPGPLETDGNASCPGPTCESARAAHSYGFTRVVTGMRQHQRSTG